MPVRQPGTIHIELGSARVRVEGVVDSGAIRAVPERACADDLAAIGHRYLDRGAAIGAGSGAGAGALTQILTKGGSIRVPAETILTFKLDCPLRVVAAK